MSSKRQAMMAGRQPGNLHGETRVSTMKNSRYYRHQNDRFATLKALTTSFSFKRSRNSFMYGHYRKTKILCNTNKMVFVLGE